MGLDIYLIRIVRQPISELNWLPAAESPELLERYPEYLTERVVQYENEPEYTEKGYYYNDLSYQRKGVKKSFYNRYKPDEFIFSEAELAELKKHIDDSHLNSFTSDYINRFKEGETIIWTSY